MIFDGKVLLNETLSGKTGTPLSSQLGGKGRGGAPGRKVLKIVEKACEIRRRYRPLGVTFQRISINKWLTP